MSLSSRVLLVLAPLAFLPACTSQDTQMTAEDFQKPENATVLAKTLSGCKMVLSSDPRAANCKAANNAKFFLDAKEIGRIRRQQVAQRDAGPDVTSAR
ncbi:MAG: hypothetical protein JWN07_293 [Hyphomicrobiales bacterium]|nr:hypothetical protein [Hyphomicrobiales bacterium]